MKNKNVNDKKVVHRKFKVGMVDNELSPITTLQYQVRNYFDVVPIELNRNSSVVLDEILSHHLDGLIIDYKLSDSPAKIPYNGVHLFREITRTKLRYPAIILTSFEDDILENIDSIDDPFQIISKTSLQTQQAYEKFATKFVRRIEIYKNNILKARSRHSELVNLSYAGALSVAQEEELLRLDSFLEQSIYGTSSLPSSFKVRGVADQLAAMKELLESVGGNKRKQKKS